jgi:hypothetical protein
LKLLVNQQKSAVAPVRARSRLARRLFGDGSLEVAPASLRRLKDRIRPVPGRNRPGKRSVRLAELHRWVAGWLNDFCLACCRGALEKLAGWRQWTLRCLKLKHWNAPQAWAAF